MASWRIRFHDKWPHLASLYASTHQLDEDGKHPDPMMGQDNVFDPTEPYNAYRYYIQPVPRSEFSIEEPPYMNRPIYKDEESRSSDYTSGDSFHRGSTCRVLLCVSLVLSFIGVVVAAITLAVLLSKTPRPGKSALIQPEVFESQASLMDQEFNEKLLDKDSDEFKKLSKELCDALEQIFTDHDSPVRHEFSGCEVVEFRNGSVQAVFRIKLLPKTPGGFKKEDRIVQKIEEYFAKKIRQHGPWQSVKFDPEFMRRFIKIETRPSPITVTNTTLAKTTESVVLNVTTDAMITTTASDVSVTTQKDELTTADGSLKATAAATSKSAGNMTETSTSRRVPPEPTRSTLAEKMITDKAYTDGILVNASVTTSATDASQFVDTHVGVTISHTRKDLIGETDIVTRMQNITQSEIMSSSDQVKEITQSPFLFDDVTEVVNQSYTPIVDIMSTGEAITSLPLAESTPKTQTDIVFTASAEGISTDTVTSIFKESSSRSVVASSTQKQTSAKPFVTTLVTRTLGPSDKTTSVPKVIEILTTKISPLTSDVRKTSETNRPTQITTTFAPSSTTGVKVQTTDTTTTQSRLASTADVAKNDSFTTTVPEDSVLKNITEITAISTVSSESERFRFINDTSMIATNFTDFSNETVTDFPYGDFTEIVYVNDTDEFIYNDTFIFEGANATIDATFKPDENVTTQGIYSTTSEITTGSVDSLLKQSTSKMSYDFTTMSKSTRLKVTTNLTTQSVPKETQTSTSTSQAAATSTFSTSSEQISTATTLAPAIDATPSQTVRTSTSKLVPVDFDTKMTSKSQMVTDSHSESSTMASSSTIHQTSDFNLTETSSLVFTKPGTSTAPFATDQTPISNLTKTTLHRESYPNATSDEVAPTLVKVDNTSSTTLKYDTASTSVRKGPSTVPSIMAQMTDHVTEQNETSTPLTTVTSSVSTASETSPGQTVMPTFQTSPDSLNASIETSSNIYSTSLNYTATHAKLPSTETPQILYVSSTHVMARDTIQENATTTGSDGIIQPSSSTEVHTTAIVDNTTDLVSSYIPTQQKHTTSIKHRLTTTTFEDSSQGTMLENATTESEAVAGTTVKYNATELILAPFHQESKGAAIHQNVTDSVKMIAVTSETPTAYIEQTTDQSDVYTDQSRSVLATTSGTTQEHTIGVGDNASSAELEPLATDRTNITSQEIHRATARETSSRHVTGITSASPDTVTKESISPSMTEYGTTSPTIEHLDATKNATHFTEASVEILGADVTDRATVSIVSDRTSTDDLAQYRYTSISTVQNETTLVWKKSSTSAAATQTVTEITKQDTGDTVTGVSNITAFFDKVTQISNKTVIEDHVVDYVTLARTDEPPYLDVNLTKQGDLVTAEVEATQLLTGHNVSESTTQSIVSDNLTQKDKIKPMFNNVTDASSTIVHKSVTGVSTTSLPSSSGHMTDSPALGFTDEPLYLNDTKLNITSESDLVKQKTDTTRLFTSRNVTEDPVQAIMTDAIIMNRTKITDIHYGTSSTADLDTSPTEIINTTGPIVSTHSSSNIPVTTAVADINVTSMIRANQTAGSKPLVNWTTTMYDEDTINGTVYYEYENTTDTFTTYDSYYTELVFDNTTSSTTSEGIFLSTKASAADHNRTEHTTSSYPHMSAMTSEMTSESTMHNETTV